jgi:hypothetical protein
MLPWDNDDGNELVDHPAYEGERGNGNSLCAEDNPTREGDNTYLPLSQKGTPEHKALCERNNSPGAFRQECLNLDWNEQVLAKKIANLATVIGRFEGLGPDILVLEEVENQQILNRLRLALAERNRLRDHNQSR